MLEGDTRINAVAELDVHVIWKEGREDKRHCEREEPHKQTWHQKEERFMKSHSLKMLLCLEAYLNFMVLYLWKHDSVKWRKFKELLEKFIIIVTLKWNWMEPAHFPYFKPP